ncbi:MAG: ClpXP protease specificity-enhancing factor [Burkholderiaceae bacterium]
MSEISTKPYMLRAIYEWCTDNGYTPYLAVKVDGQTRVPTQFVKNGEIVLNISFEATSGLKMENDSIHFNARFGGVSREIFVPVANVVAIYARENGQGMAFDVPKLPSDDQFEEQSGDLKGAAAPSSPSLTAVISTPEGKTADELPPSPDGSPTPPKKGGRPTLTRIK